MVRGRRSHGLLHTHTSVRLRLTPMLALLAVTALAQGEPPRLNTHFQGETLQQVLELLSGTYGMECMLGEGVDPQLPITVTLAGVTPQQALTSILWAHQLVAVEEDGRYTIIQRPEQPERGGQSRSLTTIPVGSSSRTHYTPYANRSYVPKPGVVPDEPDTGQERDELMQVMWPELVGADLVSAIFGGGFVEAGGFYGGGGSGGTTPVSTGPGSAGYGSAGYGSAGYGSAGYGSAGYGSAGYGSAGYGSDEYYQPSPEEMREAAARMLRGGSSSAGADGAFSKVLDPMMNSPRIR
jgi:hypothetical protein